MKGYSLWCSLLVVALVFGVAQHTNAGTLSGYVIEVSDGDNITVSNQKRPVRVKLLGVDAPEKTQAFDEVATRHLRDLILNKFVTVQYSGLGQHGVLIGKVLFHDLDIGAQMIRDGVAWFDPNNKGTLSEAECEIYRQSEEAARKEKRGLWQAGDAVAPWEFVKRARTQLLPPVSTNTPIKPATTDSRPQPGLTSESLLGLQISSGALSGSQALREIDMSWATEGPVRKTWEKFEPAGEDFVALVPSGGRQIKDQLPWGGITVDGNAYMARDLNSVYTVMWVKGPSAGETDAVMVDGMLSAFTQALGRGSNGGTQTCAAKAEVDISQGGYTGREFDFSGCTVQGKMRVFTRVVGSDRQLYMGLAFFTQEDTNIDKFLQAFTVVKTSKGRWSTSSKAVKP